MANLASKPHHVPRLMSRLALAHASRPQAIVCMEVTRAAVEGRPLEPWKDIAARHKIDPAILSRAKATLGVRYVEANDGPRINLDPALWFPADGSEAGSTDLATWAAGVSGDLIKSQSENPGTSQSGQESTSQNGQLDRIANLQSDQVDGNAKSTPGPPNGKAHAGANSGLIEGLKDNPSIPRKAGAGYPPVTGSYDPDEHGGKRPGDDEPGWDDGMLAEVGPFVVEQFTTPLGARSAEALAREVMGIARGVRPRVLKVALVFALDGCKKGWAHSPFDLIRAKAEEWNEGPIPSKSLAVFERWEREQARKPRPRIYKPAGKPDEAPAPAPAAPAPNPLAAVMDRVFADMARAGGTATNPYYQRLKAAREAGAAESRPA